MTGFVWALIVMICNDETNQCRTVREHPMFGMNTQSDCEWLRRISIYEGKLKPNERVKMHCEQIPNRWSQM